MFNLYYFVFLFHSSALFHAYALILNPIEIFIVKMENWNNIVCMIKYIEMENRQIVWIKKNSGYYFLSPSLFASVKVSMFIVVRLFSFDFIILIKKHTFRSLRIIKSFPTDFVHKEY